MLKDSVNLVLLETKAGAREGETRKEKAKIGCGLT